MSVVVARVGAMMNGPTMYAAPHGERPFGGDPPCRCARSRRAPIAAPVRAAIQRGLPGDPAARFSSLDELAPPSRWRPRVVAGLAAALVVVSWLIMRVVRGQPDAAQIERRIASHPAR